MPRIIEKEKREIRKISIVCPYYNEEAIIEKAVSVFTAKLKELPYEWELILVNDGSKDKSFEIVRHIVADLENVILITYPFNQGRGHALKTGIDAASGDIIITTEIDLSWGEDIVERIIDKFKEDPSLDIVVASPNLPGGGYKNVPSRRVWISRIGNKIIGLFFTRKTTMNTGMTRGYRREIIQRLKTDEKGKEFHLEVLLKLVTLGRRIGEVPAILEWKDNKLVKDKNVKRKSSSKVGKLILSHLNFAFFANPIRYFWSFSLLCVLGSLCFIGDAVYRLVRGEVAVFMALVGLFLGIFALLFFGFGIVTTQNNKIMKEFWRIDK